MNWLARTAVAVLLLAVLTPGVGELLENAVHLAQHEHLAHGAPEGDTHDQPGPEHDCTGALHLCSCCATLSVLLVSLQGVSFAPVYTLLDRTPKSDVAAARIDEVEHPPRA